MKRLTGLKEELLITRETFRHADLGFQKAFNEKYFPEMAQKTETENTISTEVLEEENEQQRTSHEQAPPEETLSASHNSDPEMKKMFKSIAKKTHPDKLVDVPEKEKDEKTDLYMEAISAFEREDFASLYIISEKLGLELPELDDSKIEKMEEQIKSVKVEINKLKSTFMWQWFFVKSKEEKESLVEQLFKRMYPGT